MHYYYATCLSYIVLVFEEQWRINATCETSKSDLYYTTLVLA